MRKVVVVLSLLALTGIMAGPAGSAPIHIENASFELPLVDPNGFGAWPVVDGWIELDVDELGSQNTGVFLNTEEGSEDRVENADGLQLAFLGSEQGNALEQGLEATYEAGVDYSLTVGVCISAMFPPAQGEPVDMLELAFYYDANGTDRIDIASEMIGAAGLSSTELQDVSLHLPVVEPNDPWAGEAIGIAIRAVGVAGGFWDLDNVRLDDSKPVVVDVPNGSFEMPTVDPNGFGAWPLVDDWIELDLDPASQNTGVFLNTAEGSPDRVENADGLQLAFLGSQQGNALEQDLEVVYEAGWDYQLTVGVAISARYPPKPADMLELACYYFNGPNSIDIAVERLTPEGLSSIELADFSAYLPRVEPGDPWAGLPIGVAIRSVGEAGGFWDLDNVRLLKSQPSTVAVQNASFETPVIDPNAFPALPYAPGWRELDNDLEASANTGVFGNTSPDSWDHMNNADGNQLAFLGTQAGNGFEQDLAAVYQAGRTYRLTVGVGISSRYPPSIVAPLDTLEVALYYVDDSGAVVDVIGQIVTAEGISQGWLTDYSLSVPRVQADAPWAGKPIGVAIRATGQAGGFWDLDHVRLVESVLGPESSLSIGE